MTGPGAPGAQAPAGATPLAEPDHGLYVLWLAVEHEAAIRVGSLGELHVAPGIYAYVGSAQRRRSARIARHLRAEKVKRWHIDYLRPYARPAAVSCAPGGRSEECRLAERLAAELHASRPWRRFGAGDCRCAGHLLRLPDSLGSGWLAAVTALTGLTTVPLEP